MAKKPQTFYQSKTKETGIPPKPKKLGLLPKELMKSKVIPWTLVHHNAPKGLDSLYGTVRVYLSPNQKTIEVQTNNEGLNNQDYSDWSAWIIRIQYGKDGWQIKKDNYTPSARHIYEELFETDEKMKIEDIHYSIVTYAISKKDQYLMNLN